MIFRRIKAHIEKENWFAVFIDFAIVVFGVFIGLQVANWNAARGEEQRGGLLKERLIAEFTRIEAYIADNIRRVEDWQTATEAMSREILNGGLTATRDDLSSRLNEVTGWIQPPGTSATYNEIVSQGDMDLLKSPGLRAALVDYKIVAERHLDANLVLFQSLDQDWNSIHRISSLASVSAEKRPESFTGVLQNELASADLYIGITNFVRARSIDINWHRLALEDACEVLQALEQPCEHAVEVEEKETAP